jgi:sterol desaturase/sphingolipid hydroxylase (fatty acid hydroxylase superfamily)
MAKGQIALAPSPPQLKPKVLTLRAFLLGFLALVVNTYWVTVVEVRWYSLDGSCLPIFITPVFILLVLIVLNGLLNWLVPRLRPRARRTYRRLCHGLHLRNPFRARHAPKPFRANESRLLV